MIAESKYEALRMKDCLTKQIDDCCCEVKMQSAKEACDIQQKIDATTTAQLQLAKDIQTNNYRDKLTASKTENLIFKYSDGAGNYPWGRGYGYDGYDGYGRGRSSNKVYNYIDPRHKSRSRSRSHSGSHSGRSTHSSKH